MLQYWLLCAAQRATAPSLLHKEFSSQQGAGATLSMQSISLVVYADSFASYLCYKGDVLSMGDLVEGFWEPQLFKGAGGLSAVQADKAIYINSNYSPILDDLAQWPDLSHIHKENFQHHKTPK